MSLTINDERIAIFSDLHSPLTRWDFLETARQECKGQKIKTLILAGDVTNADSVSDYAPKQANAGLTQDVLTTRGLVADLCKQFAKVYYIKGNHDYRYVKKLGYAGSFSEVMRDVLAIEGDGLTILDDDHIWIENAAGRTYVCHPTTYSRNPLTVPKAISLKTRSHVIAGHCHHSALGVAPDGESILIEAGGFFDSDKTDYLNNSSTFPKWVNGYSTVIDGMFNLVMEKASVSFRK